MVRKASAKTSSPMITTVPITKARNNLGALIQQVHLNKEYLILEKDGIPVAGIMDIDEFEDYLELQDPKVRAIIARGRQEYLAGKSRPAEDLLSQLQNRKRGTIMRRQDP
jgi:PHD/YefM family antitoxin component YafN of YafNO toxin-antitoxin module